MWHFSQIRESSMFLPRGDRVFQLVITVLGRIHVDIYRVPAGPSVTRLIRNLAEPGSLGIPEKHATTIEAPTFLADLFRKHITILW